VEQKAIRCLFQGCKRNVAVRDGDFETEATSLVFSKKRSNAP